MSNASWVCMVHMYMVCLICWSLSYVNVRALRKASFIKFNSLHMMGILMYPRNAPALCNRHIYVPSDLVHNIGCVVTKLG